MDEFSIGSVVNKLITALICVSAVIAIGGIVFYYISAESLLGEPVPFVVGVVFGLVSNIVKVLLLKRAVVRVTQITNVNSAKVYFATQYFLRMGITAAALLAAALLPDNFVSLIAAVLGVLAYPVAMHILRLFVPTDAAMAVAMPEMPDTAGDEEKDGE